MTAGPITRRIVATGTVQPVTSVAVGAQVSGIVQSLAVDFDSVVHAGQVEPRSVLLETLRITKQSLGRVLRELVDEGYVLQQEGADDRRHRLLFVTPKGEQLAMKLAGLQTVRINSALAGLPPGAHEAARAFLAAMIDGENREAVLRFIARADRARRAR